MAGSIESGSGVERTEYVEDSSPVIAPVMVAIDSALPSAALRAPARPGLALPRLTSTLLVPTTIPAARSLAADVIRPLDVVRPTRPARGTRPMIPSSVNNRAGLLSTIRDRSRAPSDAARSNDERSLDATRARSNDERSIDATLARSMDDASLVRRDLHDPNNEAPAARRSPLAISGTRPTLGIGKRGLPSSLSQRAHMFASIRDRSRPDARSVAQPADGELSEIRTPED